MLELQKTVSVLKREFQFYADKINASGIMPTIHPEDLLVIKTNLDNLIVQVKPYSETISKILQDIRNKLFVLQPFGNTFNAFQFGALGSILTYLSSDDFICNYSKYIVTPWLDINEAVQLLLKTSATANKPLEYNQAGVVARGIYISLARKFYDADKLKNYYGDKVGPSDAKRILVCYLVEDKQNEKLQKYIEAAIDLANTVTHMEIDDNRRLNALVIAVISVIGLVNDKYRNSK
jgi:hypothetical protein